MILYRSLWEDLVEILFRSSPKGPCIKILKMLCIKGACMELLLGCPQEVLVWKSGNVRQIDGHSLTILWNSVWCPGMRFWYEVLHIELIVFKALASYPPILFGVSCQCNLAISLTLVLSALFFCWCNPCLVNPPFLGSVPFHTARREVTWGFPCHRPVEPSSGGRSLSMG